MPLTLEEAKSMMTEQASMKLKKVVDNTDTTIDCSNKVNKDILMGALCRAIEKGLIRVDDLDDKMIKLLNSDTSTLSYSKLMYALNVIHKTNPNITCEISIHKPDTPTPTLIKNWYVFDERVKFQEILKFILEYFKITPHDVRVEMTKTLKPTVVNNVAQLVANFLKATDEERNKMIISIVVITRLVTMSGCMIYAEFKKIVK
jgi:hypothetical protein